MSQTTEMSEAESRSVDPALPKCQVSASSVSMDLWIPGVILFALKVVQPLHLHLLLQEENRFGSPLLSGTKIKQTHPLA